MSKFKKPKYKVYLRLFEDVRNDFLIEKFNNLKWNKLKRLLRFQKNKWNPKKFRIKKWSSIKKREIFKKKFCYLKILKFFFNHFGFFIGTRKQIIFKKEIFSILSFWKHKNLKKKFKNNLISKQRLIYYYRIQNYKLKTLVNKNSGSLNNKYDFIKTLESRLDNIIYKSGFTKNLSQSRQFINHKKILVNKIIQSKTGYLVKVGDLIEFANLPSFYIKKNFTSKKKYIKVNFFRYTKYIRYIRLKFFKQKNKKNDVNIIKKTSKKINFR